MNEEIDVRIRGMLAELDPERGDPGYWHRFHRWVVNSAGPELARRRRVARATVSEIVLSWWQTLVPTAAAAAALAGFFLLRHQAPVQPVAYMNVDEMLLEGIEAPVLPTFETADENGGIIVVNEVY